jgi:Mrp family chromosome partitioning ATPase
LVDADLRAQGLTALTRNQEQFGLRDVLGNDVPYASAVVATDVPNLYLMGAGGGNESPAELLSGTGWSQFMAWAGESFKLVLIDSPPIGIVADLNLIEAGCNGSLVVVRAHRTTQRALEEALGQIDSKKLLGVVWNEDPRSPERYSYSYQNA